MRLPTYSSILPSSLPRLSPMESSSNEVAQEFPPFFRLFKNGTIQRFLPAVSVPASTDARTGVQSKDVIISADTGVSARIFLPCLSHQNQKLPLLVYFHGGAFCIGSPFSPPNHSYISSIAAEANIIVVSVHYRLAPEHPLPAAYEDAWAAVQWVVTHSAGGGPEIWLNNHAAFERFFLMGDSAGANIAYNVASLAGSDNSSGLNGVKIVGMIMAHPFFLNKDPDELIEFLFPSSAGFNDQRLYPKSNKNLSSLASSRVKVFVAEKDNFKDRGVDFYETLKESGWKGDVGIEETEGEDHIFHLFNPSSDKAVDLLKQFASFINQP